MAFVAVALATCHCSARSRIDGSRSPGLELAGQYRVPVVVAICTEAGVGPAGWLDPRSWRRRVRLATRMHIEASTGLRLMSSQG